MLTIIQIDALFNNYHPVMSQSGRDECWLDGWIAVPPELEEKVWASLGYGDLVIEDGVLVDFIPTERPEPEPEEFPEPSIVTYAEMAEMIREGVESV